MKAECPIPDAEVRIAELPLHLQHTLLLHLAELFDDKGGMLTVGQLEGAQFPLGQLLALRWIEAPQGRWGVAYQPGAEIRALMKGPAGVPAMQNAERPAVEAGMQKGDLCK